MCPLKHSTFIPFVVFAMPFLASGLPGTAKLEINQKNAIQLNEISVPESNRTMTIDLPQLSYGFSFSTSLTQQTQDLTNRNLVFKNDVVVPLATLDSGERTTGQIGVGLSRGPHRFGISIQQDLKPSLFTSQTYGLSYDVQFYEGATILKLAYSTGTSNQPFSYYIDPGSLESKERATAINSQSFSVGIQQIWSSRFKTNASLSLEESGLFRPDETQARLATGYALNSDWTLRNEVGLALENENQILTNDRGYFQSRWLDTEIDYEWTLDSFLTVGLSFLDEVEDDPRRNRTTVLGTDEIALGVKQDFSTFTYNLNLATTINSEKQSSTSFQAGAGWVF